jgi:hypothetical protein
MLGFVISTRFFVTGVVGMVSLFLINEYDKKQGGQNGTFSNYSARAGLRN